MSKSITILDNDYKHWLVELSQRYHRSQIKAAVKVNEEMLRFYWELGRDIVELHIEERWGTHVVKTLSADLRRQIPEISGVSERNIYYCKRFFKILPQVEAENTPQTEGLLSNKDLPQVGAEISPQVAAKIIADIFAVPWGHHKYIIDKCSDNPEKALFYVHQTVENGWSRNVLLNFLSTSLYERQGKAITNFNHTLPEETSDLAQELTRDPYDFAFTGITDRYNERLLKDKLLSNITHFLIELGSGFAYVGKEYRLQVGEREQFIDLLFYNLNLSCYVVIEVLCCAQHNSSYVAQPIMLASNPNSLCA